jgi:hypothetical protein
MLGACAGDPPTHPIQTGENYALRFYGNGVNDIDRVKIAVDDPASSTPGPPVNVGATDFTIEFWLRGASADNDGAVAWCNDAVESWIEGNIIIDRDRNNQGNDYGISFTNGFVAFGVGRLSSYYTICGDVQVLNGQWHHVALTRSVTSGQLCAYVDGVQDQCGNGPSGDIAYPANATDGGNGPFVVLGAEKHDASPSLFPSFNGFMDELRFSTTIRYTGAFVRPGSPFVPDASTAALYHFDEGSGDVITDTSGAPGGPSHGVRRFGGSPAGPAWVVSDAPTGN